MGLKISLRRDWLAAVVFVAIFVALKTVGSSYLAIELPAEVLIYAIAVLIVVHFGLIPLACAIFTVDLLVNVPFTADFSVWYASSRNFCFAECSGAGGLGASTTPLGGAPLWNPDANERLKV